MTEMLSRLARYDDEDLSFKLSKHPGMSFYPTLRRKALFLRSKRFGFSVLEKKKSPSLQNNKSG